MDEEPLQNCTFTFSGFNPECLAEVEKMLLGATKSSRDVMAANTISGNYQEFERKEFERRKKIKSEQKIPIEFKFEHRFSILAQSIR